MSKYIKLVGSASKHKYIAEYYDEKGVIVHKEPVRLSDVDKKCPKHTKLRLKGDTWGRLAVTRLGEERILPTSEPKFIK